MKPKLTDILSVALSTLGMDQVDWENYGRSRQGSIVIVKRLYCLLAMPQRKCSGMCVQR